MKEYEYEITSGKGQVAKWHGQTMTAREVEMVRWAFTRGASWASGGRNCAEWVAAENAAKSFFPLPKVERPRVVMDSRGVKWRIRTIPKALDTHDLIIEWSWHDKPEKWHDVLSSQAGDPGMTPERIQLLHGLLSNPTEEVDAE